eukprot:GHVT01080854.1.p3 GENE.GHVT01080854.1~~GHVT01080854.1.p3  ORF type:complete len:143 (+),score=21.51 GHVT01080854.1:6901-7329(+)
MAPLSQERSAELAENAKKLCAPGRGILAADESTGTIKKRFDGISVENTVQNRSSYRSLLFSTAGIGSYISGTILYDETIRQSNAAGEKMTDIIKKSNLIPGIKVDTGLATLPGTDDEKLTLVPPLEIQKYEYITTKSHSSSF